MPIFIKLFIKCPRFVSGFQATCMGDRSEVANRSTRDKHSPLQTPSVPRERVTTVGRSLTCALIINGPIDDLKFAAVLVFLWQNLEYNLANRVRRMQKTL